VSRIKVGSALLKIEGLSKTFGGTRALIDVDLDVREHEIHALVGQNGSGKSTLIKSLAGYHHPDPGARAWFDGEPFELGSGLQHGHDRLRFVHQDLGHVLELGVMDNLALRHAYVTGRWPRPRRSSGSWWRSSPRCRAGTAAGAFSCWTSRPPCCRRTRSRSSSS
jgi:ribose transport system ATP-binding protein